MFLIYDKEIDQSVIGSVYLHPPAEKLVSSLSYPHICEIMQVEPPVKRLFYETECIKGCWLVREQEPKYWRGESCSEGKKGYYQNDGKVVQVMKPDECPATALCSGSRTLS